MRNSIIMGTFLILTAYRILVVLGKRSTQVPMKQLQNRGSSVGSLNLIVFASRAGISAELLADSLILVLDANFKVKLRLSEFS
jgi:hypothetical protein